MANVGMSEIRQLYLDCWNSWSNHLKYDVDLKGSSKLMIALGEEENDVEVISFDLFMKLMSEQFQEDFNKMMSAVYGNSGYLETLFKNPQMSPSELSIVNQGMFVMMRSILNFSFIKKIVDKSFVKMAFIDLKKQRDSYEERVLVLQQQEESRDRFDS